MPLPTISQILTSLLYCLGKTPSSMPLLDADGEKLLADFTLALMEQFRLVVRDFVNSRGSANQGRALALLCDAKNRVLNQFAAEVQAGIKKIVFQRVPDLIVQELTATFPGLVAPDSVDYSPLLPDNCVMYGRRNHAQVVAICEAPLVRTVFVSESLLRRNTKTVFTAKQLAAVERNGLQLAFPYLMFVVTLTQGRFQTLQVFFSQEKIRKPNQMLFKCPLTNADTTTGQVCFQLEDVVRLQSPGKPFGPTVMEAINMFWATCFNVNLPIALDAQRTVDSRLASVWEWARLTSTDPRFVLSAKLQACNSTVEQMIESALNQASSQFLDPAETAEALAKRVAEGLNALLGEHLRSIKTAGKYPRSQVQALHEALCAEVAGLSETLTGRLAYLLAAQNPTDAERRTL